MMNYDKQDLIDAYNEGFNAGVKAVWRNPKKQLPEIGQICLVVVNCNGDYIVMQDLYNGEKDWKYGFLNIVAWMPKPSNDVFRQMEIFKDIVENTKPCPSEISGMVDEHFDELL